jgi:hypothetical protein
MDAPPQLFVGGRESRLVLAEAPHAALAHRLPGFGEPQLISGLSDSPTLRPARLLAPLLTWPTQCPLSHWRLGRSSRLLITGLCLVAQLSSPLGVHRA